MVSFFFFGDVAVSPFLLRGAAFLPLGWGCFVPLLFCWVVLLGFPSLGGVAVFFSVFFGGTTFLLSSVGWCCLVFSLLWVVLLFPSPLAWCCFLLPSFG